MLPIDKPALLISKFISSRVKLGIFPGFPPVPLGTLMIGAEDGSIISFLGIIKLAISASPKSLSKPNIFR